MKAANISSIPVAVPETVSQTDGDARYATLNSTGQPTAETPPTTTQHAVAVTRDTTKQLNLKKDSVKILAAAQTTALPKRDSATTPAPRKTVAKDSVAHPAPAPVNEKKPEPAKTEATPAPKEKEKEKEESSSKSVNIDESLYKSAMMLQQQGSLDQAIERYKKVSPGSRFGELARYQMAVCYKNRGQSGKARKLFKEVVRMDGSMKVAAENALKD
ncbi:tetratricopeptide repeat protein [Chitinophaga sedimenti]|uniref:tetratricopeptide repeat protein n=1 Tax=Chitinophaga sedimenti TaxID=2033606 RepID=UPI002002EB3E|nr:tetratricopeptide repeat protein [Chitinophaga sedimenti]MCK7554529.1 tetratricopeptide repeat protein [Chitinophaga sedimenti]